MQVLWSNPEGVSIVTDVESIGRPQAKQRKRNAGQQPAPTADPRLPLGAMHSINHAHHEDRFDMARSHREGYCQCKHTFTNTDPHGMPHSRWLSTVPNGAGIVEGLERPISVIDGVVDQPVSSDGIYVVLAPTPQIIAVTCHETVG